MKKFIMGFVAVLLLTANGLFAVEFDVDGAVPGKWTMDFEAAKGLAAEKQLPLLLHCIGSDWCYWCKLMEKNVFAKPEWSAYATNNIVMVLIDFPRDKAAVPEKYKSRNNRLKAQYGITGYPTFVLLKPDGQTELGRLKVGRNKTPERFRGELQALFHRPVRPSYGPYSEQWFGNRDANRDGKLSRKEFFAGRKSWSRQTGRDWDQAAAENKWAELDKNKDAVITLEDFYFEAGRYERAQEGLTPDEEPLRISLSVTDKIRRSSGEERKDSRQSSTTSTKTKTCTLSIRVSNHDDDEGACQLEWYFISEQTKSGDTVLTVVHPGKKQITLGSNATVEETVTAKFVFRQHESPSILNYPFDRHSWEAGDVYAGYIVLVTANGEILAKESNTSRFLKDEWIEKCRQEW